MKFVFAVALLCIGAVAAQTTQSPQHNNPGRQLAETLEKRAAALLQRVKHTLEELRHSGHGHLTSGLEHQEILVEALAADLKAQLANKDFIHHLHHVHVIEEDLLHLENTVSEEIAIIEHVRHEHQHQNHTAAQLIARADELVKKAKAEVVAHPHSRDARQLEHEIAVVEKLVKALQATPAPTGEQLRHDEQALARAEQALNGLIERVHHREPHHNGGHF